VVFFKWHQCAPPSNARFFWAHPSPNPKRHLDWFSRFCTTHGRASLCFTTGRPFPVKITTSYGGSGPHLIRDSLGPSDATTQTASRSVQPFYAGLTVTDTQTCRQTDRPTDHAIGSVTIGRIYVRRIAMRRNNTNRVI